MGGEMKVYVLDGIVIHIGDWDLQIDRDEHGNEVIGNPIPEGAVVEDREIIIRPDGGYAAKGCPAAAQRCRDCAARLEASGRSGADWIAAAEAIEDDE